MLTLEPITPANYEQVLALDVAPDQRHLIAPIVKSLADAFVWAAEPRVAYEGEQPVGFVMVFEFEHEGEPVVNIVRLLVDHRHQGRGVGRALLDTTIDWIRSLRPEPRRVRVATLPENETALALYRSAGFTDSGMEDGEIALWLSLVAESRPRSRRRNPRHGAR